MFCKNADTVNFLQTFFEKLEKLHFGFRGKKIPARKRDVKILLNNLLIVVTKIRIHLAGKDDLI